MQGGLAQIYAANHSKLQIVGKLC